jgi:hypothetical protein
VSLTSDRGGAEAFPQTAESQKEFAMTSLASRKPPESVKPDAAANLEEDIRHVAYDVYELCGREHGHDLDDWLFAEKEITKKRGLIVAA